MALIRLSVEDFSNITSLSKGLKEPITSWVRKNNPKKNSQ
jgi:hypothetical protein